MRQNQIWGESYQYWQQKSLPSVIYYACIGRHNKCLLSIYYVPSPAWNYSGGRSQKATGSGTVPNGAELPPLLFIIGVTLGRFLKSLCAFVSPFVKLEWPLLYHVTYLSDRSIVLIHGDFSEKEMKVFLEWEILNMRLLRGCEACWYLGYWFLQLTHVTAPLHKYLTYWIASFLFYLKWEGQN